MTNIGIIGVFSSDFSKFMEKRGIVSLENIRSRVDGCVCCSIEVGFG
jgi:hypothetical protein